VRHIIRVQRRPQGARKKIKLCSPPGLHPEDRSTFGIMVSFLTQKGAAWNPGRFILAVTCLNGRRLPGGSR
jgi:hypothetical protein